MVVREIALSEIHPFVRYVQRLAVIAQTCPRLCDMRAYDCRLLYVSEGQGTLCVDRERYELSRGELFIWKAGVNYSLRSNEANPLILICVNFDFTQAFSARAIPIPPDPAADFDEAGAWESVSFTDFPGLNRPLRLRDMQAAEPRLLEMLGEYKAQKLFWNQRLSGLMADFFVLICRDTILSNSGGGPSAAKIDGILAYLHAHFAEEIDNASLGERFGYHPNYLNRQIKLYTGQSLHQYLVNFRIARAVDLLVSTGKPVAEIAPMVGFRDLSHFSKIFKQKTGRSPSALRGGDVKRADACTEAKP